MASIHEIFDDMSLNVSAFLQVASHPCTARKCKFAETLRATSGVFAGDDMRHARPPKTSMESAARVDEHHGEIPGSRRATVHTHAPR